MNDLLNYIAAQLRHFTHEEIVALVGDFLSELDEKQQRRFLSLVARGPRPLVTEAIGMDDAGDLLDEIQALREAIADDQYVEYGVGYDPKYGTHRGFGDDSWIDEMDELFAAATSFFHDGRFQAAADAYRALFHIFDLGQDGFHFTRPDPVEALRTAVDAMKENLLIAIARSDPESDAEAVQVSQDFHYYGDNPHALLDAWHGHEEWLKALEAALMARCHRPAAQDVGLLSHSAKLMRELYRRHRALPDYEALCRRVGPQQGWPYEDLVARYREQEKWEQVLSWAEEGLSEIANDSRYRSLLQEARGEALLHLSRSAEALDALLPLFRDRPWKSPIYLKLRRAARVVGRWEALYPQLTAEMRAHVLAIRGEPSYKVVILTEACLLGYAYLLEGEWREAIAWATTPGIPVGWQEDDLTRTGATGLLRMGLAAQGEWETDNEVLTQTLHEAPKMTREYGEHLEPVAHSFPASPLLNGAVQLYERLVERAIGGRDRSYYAQAGAFCLVIRAIRRVQGREADFERYYQGLFTTYSRLPALKDELRKAIRG
jgi:tetratricopeptide (TPR) repeat protein